MHTQPQPRCRKLAERYNDIVLALFVLFLAILNWFRMSAGIQHTVSSYSKTNLFFFKAIFPWNLEAAVGVWESGSLMNLLLIRPKIDIIPHPKSPESLHTFSLNTSARSLLIIMYMECIIALAYCLLSAVITTPLLPYFLKHGMNYFSLNLRLLLNGSASMRSYT